MSTNYTALSLSQTPPLSVPLPYFLSAPLFLAAAPLLLLFSGPELLQTRWSPAMLALTHLLTLGFLGTTMLGAMQQLVPVLVGVPLPRQKAVAHTLFLLWLAGCLLLIGGMLSASGAAVQVGGVVLGLAVVLFVSLVARSILRSGSRHATVIAMALASASLTVTVAIALYLLLRFGGQLPLAHPLTSLHIGWGSLGWLFVLLAGVAYQVVPMFQITPEYPPRLRRWLGPFTAALLLLWSLQWQIPALAALSWVLLACLLLFALQTLRLQARRRRKLSDVTLDLWRVSMFSLLLVVLLWPVAESVPVAQPALLLGWLFFAGFAGSAVNGMLYKIVPFLIWLHLNNRLQQAGSRQGAIPNMKQVIPERHARLQFRLHLLSLLLLPATAFVAWLPLWPAALVWLTSALTLWWNLLQAARLCRRVLREQAVTQ